MRMNYYLYKLSFDTSVHFGGTSSALSLYASEDHFCADTLFSALCHTALSLGGEAYLNRLCVMAEAGELLLSDGMPYKADRLFIPKPCVSSETKKEIPSKQRKAAKKLEWIPLDAFSDFSESVHGSGAFDALEAKEVFGVASETAKVAIFPGEDAMPYQIGIFTFCSDCGLWFISGCVDDAQADFIGKLLTGLGLSGFGGKVSSGYGKFHVEDAICLDEPFDETTQWLADALMKDTGRYLLLSAALPTEEELEEIIPGAEYKLIRRSGFVQSDHYADENRKKKEQYFLAAGSVLGKRFSPKLYEAGENGHHPVYRFSGPVFLGVEL